MLPIHRTITLLAGLAIIACEGNSDPGTTGPTFAPTAPTFSAEASTPNGFQSVTGHYQFVGINTGNDFKYSFSAIRHVDGSISGEFEERVVLNSTGDFVRQTHGTVTCLQIVGKMARIGGLVDQATDPRFLPGTEFRLVVVDNGQGQSGDPDLGSNARFGVPGSARTFCNAGTAFNLEPVEHGNIEVRP